MTNPPNSTKPHPAPTAINCPVERMAREVGSLTRADELAEETASQKRADLSPEHRAWQKEVGVGDTSEEEQILTDRLDAIQQLALTYRAQSPMGALFQAMLGLAEMSIVRGAVEHGDRNLALHHANRIDRALQSIIGVLESCSGLTTAEVDNNYFCGWGDFSLRAADRYLTLSEATHTRAN